VRFNILQQLINQRLLAQQATKNNIVVSEELIRQYILDFPAFQENGKFSPDKARSVLASQGCRRRCSSIRFASSCACNRCRIRSATARFVSRTSIEQFMRLNGQQREVAVASIDVDHT
jgi:peptidyl-prolyl cis-trans isomerase D